MTESARAAIDSTASHLTDALDKVFHPVSPSDLFSAPIERNGTIVVTASALERAGGFGFGAGDGSDGAESSGAGGGAGGGGALNARPVAVIRIDDGGVSVVPVLDFTRILIAALGVLVAMRRALRKR